MKFSLQPQNTSIIHFLGGMRRVAKRADSKSVTKKHRRFESYSPHPEDDVSTRTLFSELISEEITSQLGRAFGIRLKGAGSNPVFPHLGSYQPDMVLSHITRKKFVLLLNQDLFSVISKNNCDLHIQDRICRII